MIKSDRRISLSISKKFEDVFQYLSALEERKENISDFFCQAAREKIERDKIKVSPIDLKAEIKKIVLDVLKDYNPVNKVTLENNKSNIASSEISEISDDILKKVADMFD